MKTPKTSWAKCRDYEEQLHAFRALKELGAPIYQDSWDGVNRGHCEYFKHISLFNGTVQRCTDQYSSIQTELSLPDFMAQFQKYKHLPLIGYQAKPEDRKRIKKRLKELGLWGESYGDKAWFEVDRTERYKISLWNEGIMTGYTYATSSDQFIQWIENLAMGRPYNWVHGFHAAPQVQSALDEIEALKAENANLKAQLKHVRTVKDALMEIPEPFRSKAIANTSAKNLAKTYDGILTYALQRRYLAFDWSKSPEGYTYWLDVFTFLEHQRYDP